MNNSNKKRCLPIVLAAALGGCAMPQGVSMRQNGAPPVELPATSALLPRSELSFLVSPLDKVRVQILPLPPASTGSLFAPFDRVQYEFTLRGPDYHVLRGDDLTVRFDGDPKLESVASVRPDGKITLPSGVEITAEGKTPLEIAADVDRAYRTQLIHPNSSVVVTKTNLALAELAGQATVQADGSISVPRLGRFAAAGLSTAKVADDLSAAASKFYGDALDVHVSRMAPATDLGGLIGFDQTVTVTSGGLLALPHVGFIDTKGKSVSDVQAEIQRAVASYDPNPCAVVVAIEASDSRMVYVDGEVGRPGAYAYTSGMTLLKAITVAGGATDTGDMRSVVLIHRNADMDVFVYVSDLANFIKTGTKGNDLVITPQDIVVVSKTAIAKADLWIDQYITRMLPFSRDVTYSYSQGVTRLNNP
jgi:protein involved in polysaccharide export with SLBB domain